MPSDPPQNKSSRILRFAVSTALLVGPPAGLVACGGSEQEAVNEPFSINQPDRGEVPPEDLETSNEMPEEDIEPMPTANPGDPEPEPTGEPTADVPSE